VFPVRRKRTPPSLLRPAPALTPLQRAGRAGSSPARAARRSRGPVEPRGDGTVTRNQSTVIRGAEHGGPRSGARRPWEFRQPMGQERIRGARGESAGHALGLEPGRFRRPRGLRETAQGRSAPACANRPGLRSGLPDGDCPVQLGPVPLRHSAAGPSGIGQSASRTGADSARGG
jgi:hypothetical protein